jgi:hypothetical protein
MILYSSHVEKILEGLREQRGRHGRKKCTVHWIHNEAHPTFEGGLETSKRMRTDKRTTKVLLIEIILEG